MTAKRTVNPNFGAPLRASCLALESAEREYTRTHSPFTSACFLWADLREGRVLGMCQWRVLRTVEFASETFFVVLRRESGLALPNLYPAANFAGNFRQISPPNFAGKFCQANFPGIFHQKPFASEIFRRKTPKDIIWLSSLLSSFGLSCLRT